jgi:Protein of unknown function (DUF3467)
VEGGPPQSLEVRVPPELESGSYANIVGVWHSPHEFTLDFSISLPAAPAEGGSMVIPCQVVSRVKVAPTLIFDLMRTLNENMTNYEATFGEIRRPGPPQEGSGQ